MATTASKVSVSALPQLTQKFIGFVMCAQVSSAIYAFELTTRPALSMGYLYIADINSAARDSGAPIVSSEATTLSPQLAARASGALFAGDFFGILQHFDYTQGQQQDIYQARGVSRVSVLPKTVYLDMYGALEQRSIDSDPLVEQNRFQLSERRSDVYSLSATPTVALHGARTYTELKYTREMSRVRASNVGDYDGNQFQASIASANTEVNQASWKSFALWRDTAFRDRGESKSRDLGGNYRFNLSSVVELDLTGGGEYNLQPYVSTVRNDYQFYWLAGARLRPSSMLNAYLSAGRRNLGTTYRGMLTYRVRELELSSEYSEAVVDSIPFNADIAAPSESALFLRGPHVSRRTNISAAYHSTRTQAQILANQDRRGYAFGDQQDVLRNIQVNATYRVTVRSVISLTTRLDYNESPSVLVAGYYVGGATGVAYLVNKYVTFSIKAIAYNRNYQSAMRDVKNAIYIAEITLKGS